MRLVFSSLAETDLAEIGDYIAQDSPAAARNFLDRIERRCRAILDAPAGGTPRPELAENLRSVPFGAYIIYYEAEPDRITVWRVRHSARDLPGLFEGN